MDVKPHRSEDLDELRRRVRGERDAEQRDRLRVALLALGGGDCPAIMAAVGRSRGFVQRWAYAYRDGGIDALRASPRGGSKPRLARRAAAVHRAVQGRARPGEGRRRVPAGRA